MTAAAITTFAPPMETFSKGRDFAAWVGLAPRQHSNGGKDRLGHTQKMTLLRKGEDYGDPAIAAAQAGVVGLSPDVRGNEET